MFLRNLFSFVIPIFLSLFTISAYGQKKVDIDKMLAENPELFTGRFTRIGIGFSSSNFSYGTSIDGMSVSPLRFHLDLGKRINRNYGTYFTITTDFLLKEISTGFDQLNSWMQLGMHLGGLFYIKGGRSYIAPEVGLGMISFDYDDYNVGNIAPLSAGIGSSLKYGYDRHLTGNTFIGGQLYITYTHAWDTEAPDGADAPIASSFMYGVSFNVKFGK